VISQSAPMYQGMVCVILGRLPIRSSPSVGVLTNVW